MVLCYSENMPRALAAIDAAIEEWQKTTCIKFVKRSAEKDYLVFLRDSGYVLIFNLMFVCFSEILAPTATTKMQKQA